MSVKKRFKKIFGGRRPLTKQLVDNRAAWERAGKVHEERHFRSLKRKVSSRQFSFLSSVQKDCFRQLKIKGKSVAHLCCNNGRELLSIKKLGAGRCVGFDFSETFVKQAKALSVVAGVDCAFVSTDVLHIKPTFYGQFDVVFISAGSLVWIPDLPKLFAVTSKLLKRGGSVFINEVHPFLRILNRNPGRGSLRIVRSYFASSYVPSSDAVAYIPGDYGKMPVQHLYFYSLSDILNSLASGDFLLERFEEHPYDVSLSFAAIEQKNQGVPMSFILIAKKIRRRLRP